MTVAPIWAAFWIQYFLTFLSSILWYCTCRQTSRPFSCNRNSYKVVGNFGKETKLEEALEKFHGTEFFSVAIPLYRRSRLQLSGFWNGRKWHGRQKERAPLHPPMFACLTAEVLADYSMYGWHFGQMLHDFSHRIVTQQEILLIPLLHNLCSYLWLSKNSLPNF